MDKDKEESEAKKQKELQNEVVEEKPSDDQSTKQIKIELPMMIKE